MKLTLASISITVTLALGVACGQDPVSPPAPTETAIPVLPTRSPVTGPVAASNIPLPTAAPVVTPTPAPTSTPHPTRTPVSLEFAILNTAREFTSKAGDGYAFDMNGTLSVRTSAGLDIEIPFTYAGDALPGYNWADISLVAPSEIVEYKVTAIRNAAETSGETDRARYAYFDAETRRWVEAEELRSLAALTDLRALLGSDPNETSNIAAGGQMKLSGQEPLDGVETHVISGKLATAGTDADLEIAYRVGVDDALLRQIEVSGDLDPSLVGALVDGVRADSVSVELAVNFSDYGREVTYKSPYMVSPRFSHDATLLDDGRTLVSGGYMGALQDGKLGGLPVASVQIYDPATATWTLRGPPDPEASYDSLTDIWHTTREYYFTASDESLEIADLGSTTRLPDNRIVSVATIENVSHTDHYHFSALVVFDAETAEWTHLSDLPTDRASPDVIALEDGRVLVVGGFESASSPSDCCNIFDLVEAYDPSTDTWQTLAPMNRPAIGRSLIELDGGRILALGGFANDQGQGAMQWSGEVEIYDPDTDRWMPAERMNVSHSQAIVLLDDGRVLATGAGFQSEKDSPGSETYDPATGEWSATGAMSARRGGHTLTLLPDGRVLAVGGAEPLGDEDYAAHATTEIFDPATNRWSPGPGLFQPRLNHSATLMPDGGVLIAGGISERNGEKYLVVSAEVIEP